MSGCASRLGSVIFLKEFIMEQDPLLLNVYSKEMYDLLNLILYEVEGFEERTGITQFGSWKDKAQNIVDRIDGRI
jgi:hypothetical protein